MDLPIVHPTAIRFYLEKIGINPRDEHSVVLGYGCLRLLEHVVKSRDWRYPHAAYQNERNHRVLSELFSEIVQDVTIILHLNIFILHLLESFDKHSFYLIF